MPKNMTEKQVLEVIDKISSKLCYKFKFGYHDVDDMKQQAKLFALEGLDKYDGKRPLENFLWTHVRNRLFNYKRDNYERPDNPCLSCPFYDPNLDASKNKCKKFSDKSECSLFYGWSKRNTNKKNIMNPVVMSEMQDGGVTNSKVQYYGEQDLTQKELFEYVDINIPQNYRKDYLRLVNGIKLPKAKKEALIEVIKILLDEREQNEEG